MTNRESNDEKEESKSIFSIKTVSTDLLVMIAVGLFIGFLTPYGMDSLALHKSIAFWVVTCIIGYFIYTPTIILFNRITQAKITIHWQRTAIATVLASGVMSFAIPILIWLFFGKPTSFFEQFIEIFPKAIVIGGVITIISFIGDKMEQQRHQLQVSEQKILTHQKTENTNERQGAQLLMQQLPLEKRGELLCLEMSDHYLKVYTDKGHHLILMRFKDALSMLLDYPGFQTHRSWWVAHSAVVSVKKNDRRVSLLLKNQIEAPISRTYLKQVKASGVFAG